ncbi:hypothetical protein SDC9_189912 [bioreactor metagenome]|uniref:Uncharacterized protein n=1 Tax=bioreactor metagenome TaxID=1076179 RepID=A0A645HTG6_9ZZZZ
MVELATVKRKRNSEFVAGVKAKSQHFTVFEFYFPKRCLVEFCQTEITTVKCAVYKLKFGKVVVGKVATVENTVFVFALCQRVVSVKSFVLYVCFCHCLFCPLERFLVTFATNVRFTSRLRDEMQM